LKAARGEPWGSRDMSESKIVDVVFTAIDLPVLLSDLGG
jgi:hypothetical protein